VCCITADRTLLYGLTTTCKYMYAPIAFGSPRYECVMGPAIGHEAIWLLPVVYMYRPGLLACSWPAYSARGWRWR
jgi:hypothetical protein